MPRTLTQVSPTRVQKRQELQLKAIANSRRLQILTWLKDPRSNFPNQPDGDLAEDGVSGLYLAKKLGLSQPTAHAHLKLLLEAGLLQSKRVKQWTFFRRDEDGIAAITAAANDI